MPARLTIIHSAEQPVCLTGRASLPFPRPARLKPGESWRVAVKMIDPRGNEELRVVEVKE